MLKKLSTLFLKPALQWYLKKPRRYTFSGFDLLIQPGVFHPGLFFSSNYLFSFISRQNLAGHRVCEVGCGSGLLSLLACSMSANVTALDISATAVNTTRENFKRNASRLKGAYQVILSDLFSALPEQVFDVIIINPPYFFKPALSDGEKAWNCGSEGEYFETLFTQLPRYSHPESGIWMILADNCDIERIKSIARKHNCTFALLEQKKIYWEVNFIYRLKY